MMSIPGARRLVVIWALIIALTIGSWGLGIGHGSGQTAIDVTAVVLLALSMIKAHLVAFEFMEVRNAPWSLRLAVDGWALATFATLTAVFLTT